MTDPNKVVIPFDPADVRDLGQGSLRAAGVQIGAGVGAPTGPDNYDYLFSDAYDQAVAAPATVAINRPDGPTGPLHTYIAPPASNERVAEATKNGFDLAAQDKYAPLVAQVRQGR